jgi:hypothetical protein
MRMMTTRLPTRRCKAESIQISHKGNRICQTAIHVLLTANTGSLRLHTSFGLSLVFPWSLIVHEEGVGMNGIGYGT